MAMRGRRLVEVRLRRLRARSWHIVQCAVAAAVAWYAASALLGHPTPFFAPVVALVSLGVSYAARLQRVVEVITGAAVGVAVGDAFVRLVGSGVWQIALVVAVAMSLAVLLGTGPILVTQAGVQAVMVTTLLPATDAGLQRWLDALVGGGVALVAAALVPASPLRRPRRLVARVLRELADDLAAGAAAARGGDPVEAGEALDRARGLQAVLDDLAHASAESGDITRISPWWRRYPHLLPDIDAVSESLDYATRNVRVLLRRITAATTQAEHLPDALLALVEDLAAACDRLADDLATDRPLDEAIAALDRVATASAIVPHSSLSGDAVLAQVRSTVIDLYQVAGLEHSDALARVPPWRMDPGAASGGASGA